VTQAAPTPREWLAERPFPWPPTLSLADGDDVVACFTVTQVGTGRTRNNAPFLRLQLADCYGTLEARMWEGVDEVADMLRTGSYIGVRGRIERYQDDRQLRVDHVTLLSVELDDLVLFLPRSARPAAHMDAELHALLTSVGEPGLRALLSGLLGAETDTGRAFRLAPAAKQNHHAWLGGLLEHTLSVCAVCDTLAAHYGSVIDRDLLIAGALLHDIGKVREIGARAGFPYTDEGKLLGHILIGLQMVADAAAGVSELGSARLLLLQHLLASHQGRYEWHSPREPRTLEALILHYADDLDAKLNQAATLIDAVPAGWSAYDRSLGRDFLRHIADPADARDAEPTPAAAPAGAQQAREPDSPIEPHTPSASTSPAPDRPPDPAADTLDLFDAG
jgi:3'-5' exoribonuclease